MKVLLILITATSILLDAVNGLFWSDDRVTCRNITDVGRVCATYEAIKFYPPDPTPSDDSSASSTAPYSSPIGSSSSFRTDLLLKYVDPHTVEGTINGYTYVKNEQGQNILKDDIPVITTVQVYLDSNYNCRITVDDTDCTSCSYCDDDYYDEQFTADCTNIEHGRMVTCESAKLLDYSNEIQDLFFPLNSNSPATAKLMVAETTTTGDGGVDDDSTTTTTSCTPCDNKRTQYMINTGKNCNTWKWGMKNKCNKDDRWETNGYCRDACYKAGNGYVGDDCCEQDDTSNTPNCTDCDDIPTPYMKSRGLQCNGWPWGMNNRCNKNVNWEEKGYCRYSCYKNGKPYDGDHCCK